MKLREAMGNYKYFLLLDEALKLYKIKNQKNCVRLIVFWEQ